MGMQGGDDDLLQLRLTIIIEHCEIEGFRV